MVAAVLGLVFQEGSVGVEVVAAGLTCVVGFVSDTECCVVELLLATGGIVGGGTCGVPRQYFLKECVPGGQELTHSRVLATLFALHTSQFCEPLPEHLVPA